MMCEYALERKSFGEPLANKQTVQNWIADSAAEIEAARLLTLKAAWKLDREEDARVEISVIKFFAARVLHDVIDRAIQVHGALGYSKDTPLEMFYRDARAARIYDGPDEVHRQAVAQRVLKAFKRE
jgi:alkylation response protein AidB-like acyl-CoA dehydrogenase